MRRTHSAGSDKPSCLTVKIGEEVRRFVDANAVELGGGELGCEPLPADDGNVFGGGDESEELGDFFVQKAVVEGVEDLAVHEVFELFQVDDEAGGGVDFPFHGYFEDVVVAVSVGVVALAENALVLLRREVGVVIEMRSG